MYEHWRSIFPETERKIQLSSLSLILFFSLSRTEYSTSWMSCFLVFQSILKWKVEGIEGKAMQILCQVTPVDFLPTPWVLKMAVASSWFQRWLLCASELWQWQTGSGGFSLRSSHGKSMAWWFQHWCFVMSIHINWLARALFRNKNHLTGKIFIYFLIEKKY